MAGINFGLSANLSPEARQQMTALLSNLVTQINMGGGESGGSGAAGLTASTGRRSAGTRAKSGSTRGGTSEQHAKAGAQSHKNDGAPAKRGRRSKAEIAAANQQA